MGLGALLADAGRASREPLQESELDALFERSHDAVTQERGLVAWLRSRATPIRWVSMFGLISVLVLFELSTRRRVDISVYPIWRMALEVLANVLTLLSAVWLALRPLQEPGRRSLTWMCACLALATPLALALSGPAHLGHPASLEGTGADFWPRVTACFLLGTAISFPVWVALAAFDRWASRSRSIAVLAAGLLGIVGNFALHMHCPLTSVAHRVAGHAMIGFALWPVFIAIALLRSPRS